MREPGMERLNHLLGPCNLKLHGLMPTVVQSLRFGAVRLADRLE